METLTTTSYRRALAFIFGLALIASIAFQGTRGLYETTEARYAECARQTIARGALDEPWLNGDYHWTKPPITYWAIGAGLKIFGVNTWGARAYLVLAYLGAVAAVCGAGGALWRDRRAGLASALVFATSPFVLGGSWSVSTDMLAALWQALAVCGFLLARRKNSRAWLLLMWIALGLAFMTKGPPAMLCLIGMLTLAWLERRDPAPRPRLLDPLGLLIFAAIAFPWYLIENYKFPEQHLLRYWVMKETIARNIQDEYRRNPSFSDGVLMYLPILLAGALPWPGLVLARRKRIDWPRGAWLRPLRWPWGVEWTFLLTSLFIPLIIFMLSKSKLPLYMLPLFVPCALALGKGLLTLVDRGAYRARTLAAVAIVIVALYVAAKCALGTFEVKKDMQQVKRMIDPVIAAHPDYKFYSMYHAGLNGLQFYLGQEIPLIDGDTLRKELRARSAAGQGTLLLVIKAKETQSPISKMLKQGLLYREVGNKDWVLLSNMPERNTSPVPAP